MTETSNMHIAVVGAGPGGYAAAFLAADLGMKVTLIDPELNPGGVCLYRGCIPSKALLHVAKLIGESQHAKKRCACSVRDCTKWNCRSTVAESCCLLTASFWLRDHGQPSFPLSSSTLRA